MSRSARQRHAGNPTPFDPVALSGGAVTAWYRVDAATVTGSGVSILPDELNAANPAVQATDALRPSRVSTSNGILVLENGGGGSKVLTVPPVAGNSQVVTWGYAGWIRRDTTGSRHILRSGADMSLAYIRPGDSLRIVGATSGALEVNVHTDGTGTNFRQALTPAGAAPINTWVFVTFEIDMLAGSEAAKVTITIGGVAQTLSFGGVGPGLGGISALQPMTDAIVFMNSVKLGGSQFSGRMASPMLLGAKQSGATVGLLTTAGRNGLMAGDAPS